MSIDNNTIRGAIDVSKPVIPVFKINYNGNIMFGSWFKDSSGFTAIGLNNAFDNGDQSIQICAAKVKWSNGTVRLSIVPILDFNGNSEIEATYTPVSVDENHKVSLNVKLESIIKLSPVGSSGDNMQLYAGIWYKTFNLNSEILYKVLKPKVFSSGYPGFPSNFDKNNIIFSKAEVTFIPFTKSSSIFSGNNCTSVSSIKEFYTRFTSWVKVRYMSGKELYKQENCNKLVLDKAGDMKKPLNCLFTGATCNGNSGYEYCLKDQRCGSCFGACNNGMKCFLDPTSNIFRCQSENFQPDIKKNITVVDRDVKHDDVEGNLDNKDGPTKEGKIGKDEQVKSSNDNTIVLVTIGILFVITLIVFFFIKQGSHENIQNKPATPNIN